MATAAFIEITPAFTALTSSGAVVFVDRDRHGDHVRVPEQLLHRADVIARRPPVVTCGYVWQHLGDL
jgi:hypothetical protein